MRVLHVQDKCGLDGARIHGVQRLLLWWWPVFRDSEADLSLCVLRDRNGASRSFDDAGIEADFLERGRFDPRTLTDLLRVIRQRRIEILHCHGYGSTTFGRLAGRWCGIPVVVHEHMVDSAMPWYQKIVDRILARTTDRAIGVSSAVVDFLVHGRHVPSDRVEVVYNSIPQDYFRPRSDAERARLLEQHGLDPTALRVGIVGRLHPIKGHRDFLLAAAQLVARFPRVQFVIVGDGALGPELEALTRELDLTQRVRFLGHQTDVAGLVSLFDVLAVPSLMEGFSLTAAEAMAGGVAVVATRVGGIPEVVQDGATGLLVSPGDPGELATAIGCLLDDADLRNELGRRGREVCEERFSTGETVRRFCEIYRGLLTPRPRG